jgi:hypothetical protein
MCSGRRGFSGMMRCNAFPVRLGKKLGFVLEGVARKDAFLDGRFERSACYSMLSREFRQKFGDDKNSCQTLS